MTFHDVKCLTQLPVRDFSGRKRHPKRPFIALDEAGSEVFAIAM
jgi:hypothetical protein